MGSCPCQSDQHPPPHAMLDPTNSRPNAPHLDTSLSAICPSSSFPTTQLSMDPLQLPNPLNSPSLVLESPSPSPSAHVPTSQSLPPLPATSNHHLLTRLLHAKRSKYLRVTFPSCPPGPRPESIHPLLPYPYVAQHMAVLAHHNPLLDSYTRVKRTQHGRDSGTKQT
jgi:hypothetical protein